VAQASNVDWPYASFLRDVRVSREGSKSTCEYTFLGTVSLGHTTDDTEKLTQSSRLPPIKRQRRWTGWKPLSSTPSVFLEGRGFHACMLFSGSSVLGGLGHTTDDTEKRTQTSRLPPIKRQRGWTGWKPLSSKPSVILSRGEVVMHVCFSQDRQSWGCRWTRFV